MAERIAGPVNPARSLGGVPPPLARTAPSSAGRDGDAPPAVGRAEIRPMAGPCPGAPPGHAHLPVATLRGSRGQDRRFDHDVPEVVATTTPPEPATTTPPKPATTTPPKPATTTPPEPATTTPPGRRPLRPGRRPRPTPNATTSPKVPSSSLPSRFDHYFGEVVAKEGSAGNLSALAHPARRRSTVDSRGRRGSRRRTRRRAAGCADGAGSLPRRRHRRADGLPAQPGDVGGDAGWPACARGAAPAASWSAPGWPTTRCCSPAAAAPS